MEQKVGFALGLTPLAKAQRQLQEKLGLPTAADSGQKASQAGTLVQGIYFSRQFSCRLTSCVSCSLTAFCTRPPSFAPSGSIIRKPRN